ncbi:YebC/PmpR family DNA-binding transcriptional regulator [Synechococcus sp. BMK-MC-1]|uniref:YebC/PmpR family DNA-binding transcriptional regulator n=1 Tax=Synechococcus sp. BMK-MC-1 TaxID=1442551 RepID=UPI00164512A2|nr:YebC/PmpR family DNA-binding transcriptional regulator [Synechococcus sp. BMK-MC-1]QNI68567.1 putative transcriptional regulator YebC [Synechococcus sp. BMK-MC-1]
MAGHSKWSQIKRTKAVVDAKRGAVFTRIGREITVAARQGADPNGNFQLRTAIAKAKAAGVPAGNIERAIAKGSGQGGEAIKLESIRYEGYGPGGVAVLVEALSDNRNRTAAELRLAFSKHGGNLGESGCVSYLFQHRSEVRIEADAEREEALLESLLSLEADGYELGDDGQALVHGPFEVLESLQNGLRQQSWQVQEWTHAWHPLTQVVPQDPDTTRQCLKLLEALEDLDDVNSISTNLEIDDAFVP